MLCPKCLDSELRRGKVRGTEIELDQCPRCQGFWFDDGELGAVLGEVAAQRAEIPGHAKTNERLRCPRCSGALAWFCFPGTTTVVDACRGCNGVWLDGGELKAVRASLSAPVDEMRCPKCGVSQPRAESCSHCGIIVDRYHGDAPVLPTPQPAPTRASPRRGGGIKESLLQFIDDAISRLTTF